MVISCSPGPVQDLLFPDLWFKLMPFSTNVFIATTWFSKIHSYHITFLQNMIPLNPTYLYLDQQLTSKITTNGTPGMFVEKNPQRNRRGEFFFRRQALEELMEGMAPPRRCLDVSRWPSGNHWWWYGAKPGNFNWDEFEMLSPKNWWMSQKLGMTFASYFVA